MTLSPVDHWAVTGVPGPEYKVGPRCCNPTCGSYADDPHHMWRRTRHGGAHDWIQIDDYVVANKVGVCRPCHMRLTEDKEAIRFDEDSQLFWWCIVTGVDDLKNREYQEIGLLEPQPPTPLELATASAPPKASDVRCPTCGQQTRRRGQNGAAESPRRRKTWLVRVPDDELERGADVLDALIENLAPYVPNADSSTTGRYYVLVPVLVYATQDAKAFVEAMEGIGG